MGNKRRERQKKYAEERLNSLDSFGNRDRTPQEAVANIIKERKEIQK